MSMAALRWARGMRGITSTQKLVLWALADMANDYAEAWPSAIAIAADCCLSDRAVRDALDDLEAMGLIGGERAKGRSARWVLHLDRSAPEPRAATPEPPADTPEPRSALPEKRAPAVNPGTTFRTTPEPPSGVPRNHVPDTPEPRSDRTLKNPHRTPIEPPALPDWLPLDAWADWCRHKGRKWGQGQGPARAIAALGRYRSEGHDPRAVIDHSLACGYAGLYPPKGARPAANLDWTDTDPLFGGRA